MNTNFLTEDEIRGLYEGISDARSRINDLRREIDTRARSLNIDVGDYSENPFSRVRYEEMLKRDMHLKDAGLRSSLKNLENEMKRSIYNSKDLEEVDRFLLELWDVKNVNSLHKDLSIKRLGDLESLVRERIRSFAERTENENIREFLNSHDNLILDIEKAISEKVKEEDNRIKQEEKYRVGLELINKAQENCLSYIESGVELDSSIVDFFTRVANNDAYGTTIDNVLSNGEVVDDLKDKLEKLYTNQAKLEFYREVNSFENSNLNLLETNPVKFKRSREELANRRLNEIDARIKELQEQDSNLDNYSTSYETELYKLQEARKLYLDLRDNYPETEPVANRIIKYGQLNREIAMLTSSVDAFNNSKGRVSYNGKRNDTVNTILKYQLLQALVDKKELENSIKNKPKGKASKSDISRLNDLDIRIKELSDKLGMNNPSITNLRQAKELLFKYNEGVYNHVTHKESGIEDRLHEIRELENYIKESEEKLREDKIAKDEAEAKRKAEEEAKRKAEEEAKRKAEEEAKRKAEEEAKRKAEEEANEPKEPENNPVVPNNEPKGPENDPAVPNNEHDSNNLMHEMDSSAKKSTPRYEYRAMCVSTSETPDKLLGFISLKWLKRIQSRLRKKKVDRFNKKFQKSVAQANTNIAKYDDLKSELAMIERKRDEYSRSLGIIRSYEIMQIRNDTLNAINDALNDPDNYTSILHTRINELKSIDIEHNEGKKKMVTEDLKIIDRALANRNNLDYVRESNDKIREQINEHYDFAKAKAEYAKTKSIFGDEAEIRDVINGLNGWIQTYTARIHSIQEDINRVNDRLDNFDENIMPKYEKQAREKGLAILDISNIDDQEVGVRIVDGVPMISHRTKDGNIDSAVLIDDNTMYDKEESTGRTR